MGQTRNQNSISKAMGSTALSILMVGAATHLRLHDVETSKECHGNGDASKNVWSTLVEVSMLVADLVRK